MTKYSKKMGLFLASIISLFLGLMTLQVRPAQAESCNGYLEPYWTYHMTKLDGKDSNDSFLMMGENYHQGIIKNAYIDCSAAYNLDAAYNSVSFVVGPLDKRNTNKGDLKVTLSIYLDGKLNRSLDLSKNMISQKVTLNTAGVTQLYLTMKGDSAGFYGLGNVIVSGHQFKETMYQPATLDKAGSIQYQCANCGQSKITPLPVITTCTSMLNPYNTSGLKSCSITGTDSFSMMGHIFRQGVYRSNYGNTEGAYNLGSKYSSVTFTVGHMDNHNTKGNDANIEKATNSFLDVYLDNQLTKTIPLTVYMPLETYKIPTVGITQLRFVMRPEHGYDSDNFYAIGNISGEGTGEHSFVKEVLVPAGPDSDGVYLYTCENCGATKKETIPGTKATLTSSHVSVISKCYYNGTAQKPSVKVVYNGSVLKKNEDYTVEYKNNNKIGKASVVVTGRGNYTGVAVKNFTISVKKGQLFTVSGIRYQVLNSTSVGVQYVKNSMTKITVPSTVKFGGKNFYVTSIGSKAFANGKATNVVIGSQVKSMGDKVFYGCKYLTRLKIESRKLTKTGEQIFKGISGKAVIQVPADKYEAYKLLLQGKGQSSTVKIIK